MVLTTGSDIITLFVIAAVGGALGGLVSDLLLVRSQQSGTIEFPRHLRGAFYDLGTLGSLLIGAVAAMVAVYIFPPETVTTLAADGTSTSVTRYELFKLIPLALLIGSVGSAFLAAAQTRVLAAAKQQQLEDTKRVADQQLTALASEAGQLAGPGGGRDNIGVDPVAGAATRNFQERVEQARNVIRSVGE